MAVQYNDNGLYGIVYDEVDVEHLVVNGVEISIQPPRHVIMNENFNSYTPGANVSATPFYIVYEGTGSGNQKIVETIQADGNTGNVLQMQGKSSWTCQVRSAIAVNSSKRYLVLCADIKSISGEYVWGFGVGSSGASGQWTHAVCGVSCAGVNNIVIRYYDGGLSTACTINPSQWTNIRVVLDKKEHLQYNYIDGILVNPDGSFADSHAPEWVFLETGNGTTNTQQFDNIFIYEYGKM